MKEYHTLIYLLDIQTFSLSNQKCETNMLKISREFRRTLYKKIIKIHKEEKVPN